MGTLSKDQSPFQFGLRTLLLFCLALALDARRPVAPGSFKIHGEYFAVVWTLDLLSISLLGLIGIFLGVVAPGAAELGHQKFSRGLSQNKSDVRNSVAAWREADVIPSRSIQARIETVDDLAFAESSDSTPDGS